MWVDGDAIYAGVVANDDLLFLEFPDLETMLVRSPALESLLIEFGSRKKLLELPSEVREVIISAAKPMGCLRIHSLIKGLGLKFDSIRHRAFVNAETLEVDRHALVDQVKRQSQRLGVECRPLLETIRSREESAADDWAVCCGDDLIALLGVGLRKMFGTNNAGEVARDKLVRSLRLGYSEGEFRGSRMYRDLIEWATRNPGFEVLSSGLSSVGGSSQPS